MGCKTVSISRHCVLYVMKLLEPVWRFLGIPLVESCCIYLLRGGLVGRSEDISSYDAWRGARGELPCSDIGTIVKLSPDMSASVTSHLYHLWFVGSLRL